VIETVRGVEEFDSRDRALVWRVTGGKHRYLIDQAQVLVPDAIEAFAQAASDALQPDPSTDPDTALAALQERHAALKRACRPGAIAAMAWRSGPGRASPPRATAAARHRCLPHRHRRPEPAMSMPLQTLLDALFPHGHAIAVNDSVLTGSATTEDGEVTVIGTTDRIEVGVDHALALAETVLASTAAHPQRPIVMLVDTAGQRLAAR
jgi:hypothetical protein